MDKIPYLADLGVSVLQLMPIQEFPGDFSLGYNGTDYFSPEMAFGVGEDRLAPYLARANELLEAKGLSPFEEEHLRGEMNQLKALIDLCHAYGLAIILDLVFNHAGGGFGTESLWFFDRQNGSEDTPPKYWNSLFFSDKTWAGGNVFNFQSDGVRQFLINNALFLLDEYRVDGFRYDEVSVIDSNGYGRGWDFCQALTGTLRTHRPSALQHAEYWPVNPWVVKETSDGGTGFHTTMTDGLRIALRNVLQSASFPGDNPLPVTALANQLAPSGFPNSWWARSRSRVATGLVLTSPGIPMLFMGQEFLEDKQWSDDVKGHPELRIYWDGLNGTDPAMRDFLCFTRELIRLRWQLPALRSEGFRVVHVHDANRVLAFHRWVPGEGQDVMVVLSLANFNRYGYRIGFPTGGNWREVFNSNVYDNWVNPQVVGNAGAVSVEGMPMHGFSYSAALTLPANSLLIFNHA